MDSVRRVAAVDPAEEAEWITVFRPSGSDAPYVADGNHYATVKTLFLLDGGEFTPQPAYLGVTDTEAGQNAA